MIKKIGLIMSLFIVLFSLSACGKNNKKSADSQKIDYVGEVQSEDAS